MFNAIAAQRFKTGSKSELEHAQLLLFVVKCAKNRAGYFAERLHDAIKGLGTKDDLLIFIMATRADVDLDNIKMEYERFFKNTLAMDIEVAQILCSNVGIRIEVQFFL